MWKLFTTLSGKGMWVNIHPSWEVFDPPPPFSGFVDFQCIYQAQPLISRKFRQRPNYWTLIDKSDKIAEVCTNLLNAQMNWSQPSVVVLQRRPPKVGVLENETLWSYHRPTHGGRQHVKEKPQESKMQAGHQQKNITMKTWKQWTPATQKHILSSHINFWTVEFHSNRSSFFFYWSPNVQRRRSPWPSKDLICSPFIGQKAKDGKPQPHRKASHITGSLAKNQSHMIDAKKVPLCSSPINAVQLSLELHECLRNSQENAVVAMWI